MQKVKLTYRTPKAVIKDGKAVVEYEVQESAHVVASTKSYNNLLEELKKDNKIPTESLVVDLFIDKKETAKAVDALVNAQIADKETAVTVSAHIMKALDGACVFKKPPVIRKK